MRFSTCLVVVPLVGLACTKLTLSRPPVAEPAPPAVASASTAHVDSTRAAKTAAAREDAAPPVPLPPARFGVLVPLSGRYALYGKAYLDGAHVAADEFNARGTRRVELVAADIKSEPLGTLAATRRLVDQENVVALLGSILTVPTTIAALEANCRGVPLVSNVATEDELGSIGPYVIHAVPSRRVAAREMASIAVLQMRRFRAAILYPEEGDGRALGLAFAERFTALGGEILLSESYAAGSTEFTAVAKRLAEARPDALYVPADADALVLLAAALAFHSVSTQIFASEDAGSERVLRDAGLDFEGTILPAPDAEVLPPAAPGRAPRAHRSPTEERLAAAGYAGTRRLLDALAQTTSVERDALQQALHDRMAADSLGVRAGRRFLVVHGGHTEPLSVP
jgi:branched-chain amino acid transport system substrate-binding protein